MGGAGQIKYYVIVRRSNTLTKYGDMTSEQHAVNGNPF